MPDHDLDAGWLLHGLSLAYTWLGRRLPSWPTGCCGTSWCCRAAAVRVRGRVRGRLVVVVVLAEPQLDLLHGSGRRPGTRSARTEWTERAKENFATVIDLLPDDGSHNEGVVYWRYGVPWLATLPGSAAGPEGIDWWDRCGFLANTFSYRLHQTAPGFDATSTTATATTGAAGTASRCTTSSPPQYRIARGAVAGRSGGRAASSGARRTQSGVKPGVMPEAYLELLWYDDSVPADAAHGATPLSAFFPDLGLVTARTGWDDEATMVSFKAAPGGGHKAWETSHRLDRERGWETLSAGAPPPGRRVVRARRRRVRSSRSTRATATASGPATTT